MHKIRTSKKPATKALHRPARVILSSKIRPLFGTGEDDDETPRVRIKVSKGGSGKRYTQEQLEAACSKARKSEKKKLFEKLETLRSDITAKDTEIADLTSRLGALKTMKGKNGPIDTEKLLSDYSRRFEKRLRKAQGGDLQKLQEELAELREEQKQTKAEKLRARLIEQAGGDAVMVVEMVSGDTEDEIEESIEKAKDAYDRITGGSGKGKKKRKSQRADDEDDELEDDDEESDEDEEDDDEEDEDDDSDDDTEKDTKARRQAPPELPERSRGGARGAGGGSEKVRKMLSSVKSMSPQEYAEKRKSILAATGKLTGTAGSGARPFRGNSARGR